MMKKVERLTLLFFLTVIPFIKIDGQGVDIPKVRIAPFKGDKACAISYTFDDALRDQSILKNTVSEELFGQYLRWFLRQKKKFLQIRRRSGVELHGKD